MCHGTPLATFSQAVTPKFLAAVYAFGQQFLAFPVEKPALVEVIVE
ncbi:MAG TPA: hypothetical protein VK129_12645 [Terriglobales bacterium]|nr:hypothetical protein [Terriglobales bacterium]